MNGGTTEEKIKDKIESLDTLQAGIVFGKEDAWDKLQARMDAKPVRKLVPFYRIAAAAALVLLFITAAVIYRSPGPAAALPVASVTQPKESTPPASYSEKMPDTFTIPPPARVSTTVSAPHSHKAPHKKQIAAPAPVVPAEEPQVARAEPIVAEPVPSKIQPLPMKVVHINELNKENKYRQYYAEQDPFPHVQFKMKVIHINDIGRPMRQEEYMQDIDKATVWRLPFGRRQGYNNTTDQPRSLFRINLSQN